MLRYLECKNSVLEISGDLIFAHIGGKPKRPLQRPVAAFRKEIGFTLFFVLSFFFALCGENVVLDRNLNTIGWNAG